MPEALSAGALRVGDTLLPQVLFAETVNRPCAEVMDGH